MLIYNPSLISASKLPTTVLQLASPAYKGKLAFAAGETDFQPIVTSVAHTYGQAQASSWLQGIKANAGQHVYPDNETIANEVNRGAVAFGVVNQYYWYRMQAELGAGNVHSKIAYFAPHDPGYVLNVSGAAILKSSKNQAGDAEIPGVPGVQAGQEIIAHSDQLRVPARRWRADRHTGDAVRPAPAQLHHDRRAGRWLDGHLAAAQGRVAVMPVAGPARRPPGTERCRRRRPRAAADRGPGDGTGARLRRRRTAQPTGLLAVSVLVAAVLIAAAGVPAGRGAGRRGREVPTCSTAR